MLANLVYGLVLPPEYRRELDAMMGRDVIGIGYEIVPPPPGKLNAEREELKRIKEETKEIKKQIREEDEERKRREREERLRYVRRADHPITPSEPTHSPPEPTPPTPTPAQSFSQHAPSQPVQNASPPPQPAAPQQANPQQSPVTPATPAPKRGFEGLKDSFNNYLRPENQIERTLDGLKTGLNPAWMPIKGAGEVGRAGTQELLDGVLPEKTVDKIAEVVAVTTRMALHVLTVNPTSMAADAAHTAHHHVHGSQGEFDAIENATPVASHPVAPPPSPGVRNAVEEGCEAGFNALGKSFAERGKANAGGAPPTTPKPRPQAEKKKERENDYTPPPSGPPCF